MKTSLVAAALFAVTFAAHAHHVWIEQDEQGAKLYFGEFGDNVRETSPGLLDNFVKPTAQRLSSKGSTPLEPGKTADGFSLGPRASKGESLIAEETAYPVFERKEGDKVTRSLFVPAARLVTDFSKQEPRLTLDLVPTGKVSENGVEFQAFYKGQPLPKATVELINQSGWSQTHHSDDSGKLTVKLPWRGTYVLEMSQRDTGGGQRANGDKWDRASFVTSLTVTQAHGLPALPTPPAGTPSKPH